MQYILLAIEGLLTFVSPCLLPMLPIYIAYLLGDTKTQQHSKRQALYKSLAFVAGFTTVFLMLNLLVTTIGGIFIAYRRYLTLLSGVWMIVLGIDFWLDNRFLSKFSFKQMRNTSQQQAGAFMFGILFSINWTPCVGTFLASVLSQTLVAQNWQQSMGMLLSYCAGLGIPFVLTAVMLDDLSHTLNRMKNHLIAIKRFGAILLILIGLLMIIGWYDYLLQLFI